MPPTAGTARFENDIESCSSAVRIKRQVDRHRAHERDRGAKFVSSEMNIATASQPEFGVLDRVVERLRVADLGQQGEDGDERADRHQQVRATHAVELLERRRLRTGRLRRRLPELAQVLAVLLAFLPATAREIAGEGRGLDQWKGLDERGRAEAAHRGGDRSVVTDQVGGAHEQLGDIAGPLGARRRSRRVFEVHDRRPGAR